jgi:class 3 adenylate cyclase
MFALTFKQKLVVSTMLVVGGVTAALLLIAERQLQAAHEARFLREFDTAFALARERQDARLGAVMGNANELASSVRFVALLGEMARDPDPGTAEIVYQVVDDELGRAGAARGKRPTFFRVYDQKGEMIPPPEPVNARFDEHLRKIRGVIARIPAEVGHFRMDNELFEIFTAKTTDVDDNETKGTLLFAIPYRAERNQGELFSGLWVEGRLHLEGISEEIQRRTAEVLTRARAKEGRSSVKIRNKRYLLLYRAINPGSLFPPAFQVLLQPLEPFLAEKRDLRWQVISVGLAALAAGLVVSLVLASGLTSPINALVRGAREIEKGQFDLTLPIRSPDEVGRLTRSFNEMAAGLLLREKYRGVLDMVADKSIAEELLNGRIELGGEEREVSVLFCDIRGFTALTERMEPKEVIQMLNEHFTPLTRLVYEHHGAVDKFVGDLIMAIFGAPKGFGNDIENAARCALRMVQERKVLNQTGNYKISVGIGVASGTVVAGRMGSKDRLNYTVLGPRVNLASRLCGQAGPMEVVIDEETWRRIEGSAQAIPTPELRLKGFAAPVHAYKLERFLGENETEKNDPMAA